MGHMSSRVSGVKNYVGLADTADRERFAPNGYDQMVGPMSRVYDRINPGGRDYLPGFVSVIIATCSSYHGTP